MKPGICFRSRKFESHIIFIGQSYFFKTNNTNQFSHTGFEDVGELIPVATFQKNGLWDKKMVPVWMNAKCLLMTVSQECVVNFLVSTRHTYVAQNTLAVVQVMYGVDDTYISVRYHHLIPKSHQLILLKLKYKKTEDNRLNIYIESNDPVVSILSASDFSRLELKNELITELPQDAIDAVEV